jgi:hypothetical protein
VAQEEAKVVRNCEKAEQAAAQAAKIKAQNTKKAIQMSQLGKRKASQAASSNTKRQKCVRKRAAVAASPEAAPAAPPKISRRGRAITLLYKYKLYKLIARSCLLLYYIILQ